MNPDMLQFLVGAACVFVGIMLFSVPFWLSLPDPAPITRRSLARYLLTLLMISLSLSALAV